MINDERWHGPFFREKSCRSVFSDNVAKIMVFDHFDHVKMFQIFWNFKFRLFEALLTFGEIFRSNDFREHGFLHISTAVNMRNKPFLAIIPFLFTWVELTLHLEALRAIMDCCCTFWRPSICEKGHCLMFKGTKVEPNGLEAMLSVELYLEFSTLVELISE